MEATREQDAIQKSSLENHHPASDPRDNRLLVEHGDGGLLTQLEQPFSFKSFKAFVKAEQTGVESLRRRKQKNAVEIFACFLY